MEIKQWRYSVNVGPTKGRIVDGDGFTILELNNHLNSTGFEKILKQICKDHNSAPDLLEALKRAAPWLGKLIADNVHLKCVKPGDAVTTLEMVSAAIAKAEGKAESGNAATDLLIVTVAGLSILAAVFTLGALPALIMLAEVGKMLNF